MGVGPVVIRHSDIVTMELTPLGFTRIEFGYGEHLIVEELPVQILSRIQALEDLAKEIEEVENNATKNT